MLFSAASAADFVEDMLWSFLSSIALVVLLLSAGDMSIMEPPDEERVRPPWRFGEDGCFGDGSLLLLMLILVAFAEAVSVAFSSEGVVFWPRFLLLLLPVLPMEDERLRFFFLETTTGAFLFSSAASSSCFLLLVVISSSTEAPPDEERVRRPFGLEEDDLDDDSLVSFLDSAVTASAFLLLSSPFAALGVFNDSAERVVLAPPSSSCLGSFLPSPSSRACCFLEEERVFLLDFVVDGVFVVVMICPNLHSFALCLSLSLTVRVSLTPLLLLQQAQKRKNTDDLRV
jgi:hypothetical protein